MIWQVGVHKGRYYFVEQEGDQLHLLHCSFGDVLRKFEFFFQRSFPYTASKNPVQVIQDLDLIGISPERKNAFSLITRFMRYFLTDSDQELTSNLKEDKSFKPSNSDTKSRRKLLESFASNPSLIGIEGEIIKAHNLILLNAHYSRGAMPHIDSLEDLAREIPPGIPWIQSIPLDAILEGDKELSFLKVYKSDMPDIKKSISDSHVRFRDLLLAGAAAHSNYHKCPTLIGARINSDQEVTSKRFKLSQKYSLSQLVTLS